jgi:tetratricopeptide (TPR) repeat protein
MVRSTSFHTIPFVPARSHCFSRICRLLLAGVLSLATLVGPAFGHGGYHERLAYLNGEVKKNPSDPRLHFELGDLYGQHGDLQLALDHLDRVDALAPGKFLTDLQRGQALLVAGQPAKAKRALDGQIASHPGCASAHLLRARASQRIGEGAASLADYREAWRSTPSPEPDLVQEVADALVAQGCQEEASQVLAKGIEKLGNPPSLVLRAMELEIATKNFDAALSRVEAMRQSAPRPEPWMARRASVLAQAGRIEESRVEWKALVEHLAALPKLERGSHAMSKLMEEARQAIASLASLSASTQPIPTPTKPKP